jgi:nuclear factor related to kappa-B-binding protein
MARRSGPALPFPHKHHSPSRSPEEREWRTQQRYLKVLREVKEECGDTALSSDEEGECPWVFLGV